MDHTPPQRDDTAQAKTNGRNRVWHLGGFGILALGLTAWGAGYYYFFRTPASVAQTSLARKDPCVDQILTQRNGNAAQVPKRDILHAEQFCRHQADVLSASHSEWSAP